MNLITGDHLLYAGEGVARIVRALASRFLRLALRKTLVPLCRSENTIEHALLSTAACGVVSTSVSAEKIRRFEKLSDYYGHVALGLDYEMVHRLADFLDRRSLEFGEEKGFSRNEMSAFRILETRWLSGIVERYMLNLAAADLFLKIHGKEGLVTLTATSLVERAIHERLPGTRTLASFPWRGLISRVQAIDERLKHAGTYRNMNANILKFAGHGLSGAIPAKKKRRVLFVGYKERTLRRIEALVRAGAVPPDMEVFVLGEFRGYSAAADGVIDSIARDGGAVAYAAEFLAKNEAQEILRTTRTRVRGAMDEFFSVKLDCAFMGYDLERVVRPFLRETAVHGVPIAAAYSEMARRAFDALDPDLVVHFEEWELNRAMTLEGRKRGVPSMAYYCLSPVGFPDSIRRLPDYFACSGSFLADAFRSPANWPAERIRIVGDPQFDACVTLDRAAARRMVGEKYGLAADVPRVLLLTAYQWENVTSERLRACYLAVAEATRKSGARLVVKIHPQQRIEEVRGEFESVGIRDAVYVHHEDLMALSAGCDVGVVVNLSTAIPILIGVRTPVVCLVPEEMVEDLSRDSGHAKAGGFPMIGMASDISSFVRSMLTDPSARARAVESQLAYGFLHNGQFDGKVVERFWDFVRDGIP